MVISGRIAFYGEGEIFFGEFGPYEGIFMPRNNRYWFESVGESDAEIIQVLHFDKNMGFEREDHEEEKFDRNEVAVFYGGKSFSKEKPDAVD